MFVHVYKIITLYPLHIQNFICPLHANKVGAGGIPVPYPTPEMVADWSRREGGLAVGFEKLPG